VHFNLVFEKTISSTQISILRGVFLGKHVASTDNETKTTNTQNAKL